MVFKPKFTALNQLFIGILLVIFGGIVLHAPLSVGFSTLFPAYELIIKSWKEILMLVASVLMVIAAYRHRQLKLFKEPLLIAISIYAMLHILTAIGFGTEVSVQSVLAGFLIDLRYILFFVLVYVAVRLYPGLRRPFIAVGIAGAVLVSVFALLQVFVLPYDALKYIGYGAGTIAPYLSLDQNYDFIRINSTLRGPNSLGAYIVIVLACTAAWLILKKKGLTWQSSTLVTILIAGGLVALWASYSRSALVAAIVAVAIVCGLTLIKRIKPVVWAAIAACIVALGIAFFVARDSSFVANVILHDNPTTGAEVTSNEAHLDSFWDGFNRMVRQPFGAGVGSTGSASLLGDKPLIIENQYFYVAHEVGWLGLLLFVMIIIGVHTRLWDRRKDWLALGVFASGIGLLLINILLPIFVDDTVAIIWWGLAALAIGSINTEYGKIQRTQKP